MKRAYASRAVVGAIVLGAGLGVCALFLGGERSSSDKPRAASGGAKTSRPLAPSASKLRPGSAAPGATAKDARPTHDEHGPGKSLGGREGPDDHEHDYGHVHGGPGADPEGAERAYLANLEKAKAIIEKGPRAVLDALRGSDRDLARAIFDALLDDPVAHCERELLEGLLASAQDKGATAEDRGLALDLLGRSPGTGADALQKIAELATSDPDGDVRLAALTAVRQLAMEREDLNDATRAALTDAAEKTTS
ncbi:MAG: hypothetical protein ACAI25_07390, partial [Planctomycetota bacterium]